MLPPTSIRRGHYGLWALVMPTTCPTVPAAIRSPRAAALRPRTISRLNTPFARRIAGRPWVHGVAAFR